MNKKKTRGRKKANGVTKKPKILTRTEKYLAKTVKAAKPKEAAPEVPLKAEMSIEESEPVQVGTGFRIAIDRIEADTIIGDLIVVFPRTREVLKKYGLNLDVEEAGDIYMSLDAFAALRGLKTPALVLELETTSKEASPQPPMAAIVATPAP